MTKALLAQAVGSPLDYTIIVVYFISILGFGTFFGRYAKSTRDFFFGGSKFSWWLIAMSLMASLVGSYSFVKYGEAAYRYGVGSTQTYLNDWFWMPFLVFGWLPLLYCRKRIQECAHQWIRIGTAARHGHH